MNMSEVVSLALIAGLLAVDDRAGWQGLFAEPVFSSLLVGMVTGAVGPALHVGVVLQLVWLSIGQARGTRRPNVVVGGLVGAGSACLALQRTGDPSDAFIVATAVFWGLLAGEAGALIARAASGWRERRLGEFRLPATAEAASRDLTLAVFGSALFVGAVDALSVLVMLPVATLATVAFTGRVAGAAAGAAWWLTSLPAIALLIMAQAFYQTRSVARFATLGLLIALVAL
jgi:mannose/fructose/N-acetylgalactosamine-specific phosphotransferase system component IIC